MLSHELEFTLNQAFRQAREKRHEFMTVEHLLQMLLARRSRRKAQLAAQRSGEQTTSQP
jgi:ATP-dependent Clp protease ATP-binding subunit ClpA